MSLHAPAVLFGGCSAVVLPGSRPGTDDLRHTTAPFTTAAPLDQESSACTATVIMGGNALGRVIADRCTRPLRIAALAQCHPYERLRPHHVAKVLLHPRGLFRLAPAATRRAVTIIGHADNDEDLRELHRLIHGDIDHVTWFDGSAPTQRNEPWSPAPST